MTPELTALLQKEATVDEAKKASEYHAEQSCCDDVWTSEEYDRHTMAFASQYAITRRTIALAVMRECAKLVCEDCANGVRLAELTYENRAQRHTWDDGSRNDRFCKAASIQNAISEAEAAQ